MPTAMITGAGGGLGSAIAAALAPTHTLFLAGRPSDRLDAVAERFGATTWPIDLADPDAIEAVVEPIVELDVLIHNAGVAYPGPGRRVDRRRVARHHRGQCHWRGGADAGAAARTAQRRAVTWSSSTPVRASTPRPAWRRIRRASSRSRASRTHCAPTSRQLRVTSIHPGRIDTEMQEELIAYEGGEYEPERFLSPETVAKVVADVVATPPDAHSTRSSSARGDCR